MSATTRKCICQICDCGNHKCPHQSNNIFGKGGPCPYSSYVDDYGPKQAERQKPFRPDQTAFQSDAPFEDATSHGEYRPHQPQKTQSMRPQENAYQSGMPFDGTTENQAQYYEKEAGKAQPYKPGYNPLTSGPFDGTTTHQSDFDPKAASRPDNFKPQQTAFRSTGPFDDATTNRADFTEKQAERARAKGPSDLRQEPGQFYGGTTYGDGFVPKFSEKPDNYKPVQSAFRSDAPFDDNTEHKEQFIKKGVHVCPAGKLLQADKNPTHWGLGDNGHKFYLRNGRASPAMAQQGGYAQGRPTNAAQAMNPSSVPM